MRYEKDKEHRIISRLMKFVDTYGNEIPNVIDYDTDTGIMTVLEPEYYTKGKLVKRTKFHPNGYAIVDDIAKPNEEQLADIREKHTGKTEREF